MCKRESETGTEIEIEIDRERSTLFSDCQFPIIRPSVIVVSVEFVYNPPVSYWKWETALHFFIVLTFNFFISLVILVYIFSYLFILLSFEGIKYFFKGILLVLNNKLKKYYFFKECLNDCCGFHV